MTAIDTLFQDRFGPEKKRCRKTGPTRAFQGGGCEEAVISGTFFLFPMIPFEGIEPYPMSFPAAFCDIATAGKATLKKDRRPNAFAQSAKIR